MQKYINYYQIDFQGYYSDLKIFFQIIVIFMKMIYCEIRLYFKFTIVFTILIPINKTVVLVIIAEIISFINQEIIEIIFNYFNFKIATKNYCFN